MNPTQDSVLPTVSPFSRTVQKLPRAWSFRSIAILIFAWLVLQIGGLFTPGLLDDVDSVYTQIAREMLQRHDFVTPTIDGIRFFDKPPLMYWMAAASMRVFGAHDWAARLPLALGVLALLFAVYALGIRFFASIGPVNAPDRGGLYAALAMATSIGPYLYTRFYIPDILIALWMTFSVHLFLLAMDRVRTARSPLLPSLGFGAVMAFDVLTKGFIGLVFPIAFVVFYLACTRELRSLLNLRVPAATLAFAVIAAPWHVLAALRNPAIAMPPSLGLPAHAGWAWFYLYNEHIARFLGRRIPHDYGQVPIPLFWALLVLWLVPWSAFLWPALRNAFAALRGSRISSLQLDSDLGAGQGSSLYLQTAATAREAALSLLLWPGIVLGFFTLSSRQEYYHLPALPALALLIGGLLCWADASSMWLPLSTGGERNSDAYRQTLRWSLYFLVPLGTLLFLVCGYFAVFAPSPPSGSTLSSVLSSNPNLYNLSLGHVFDLTGTAMGFFRGPLLTVALCMLLLGPGSHFLRRRGRTLLANLTIAAAMTGVLLAAHVGLARFYPILGSKDLALAIDQQLAPNDVIVIDGELTSGSTLLFYTDRPVLLVNGRINGPWFGSFWPDAPHIFLNDADLYRLWAGPRRVFLLTYHPETRVDELSRFARVKNLADSGGKTILTNRP